MRVALRTPLISYMPSLFGHSISSVFKTDCFSIFSFSIFKHNVCTAYDYVRNNLTISAVLRDVMMYCGRGVGAGW